MEFLKILWNNLRGGPVTEPFPHGETFTPDRLRGRVVIDPSLCVGCGTCKHVCVAGAIEIAKAEDESAFEVTVWHNTCCRCAQCRHFCPTHAITLINDWHSAHRNSEKYRQITRAHVPYDACAHCGMKMRFLPPAVLERIYAGHPEIQVEEIARLCPECRRIETAVQENRACHINHLQKLADKEEACLLPSKTPSPSKETEAPKHSLGTETVSEKAPFISASTDVPKSYSEPTTAHATVVSFNESSEPLSSLSSSAKALEVGEKIPAISERKESDLPVTASTISNPPLESEQDHASNAASSPLVPPAAPTEIAEEKTPAKKKKKTAVRAGAASKMPDTAPNGGKAPKTTSKNATGSPKRAKVSKV